jgi:hypothetical protein
VQLSLNIVVVVAFTGCCNGLQWVRMWLKKSAENKSKAKQAVLSPLVAVAGLHDSAAAALSRGNMKKTWK